MQHSQLNEERYLYSKGHAWYAFFLVFALQLFDFIDRQVVSVLLPSIKLEWTLSDTQLGMIVSAVNLAIAVLVLPTSYFVDRWSRTKSMSVMATVWSLATAACALASNFVVLLIARFFVGAGEAGYGTGASNLLAAIFPKRMRASVIGLKESGALIGSIIGVMLGGMIAARWGWRYAFGLVALPGLLFAFLIYFLKDYPTIKVESADAAGALKQEMSWQQMLKLVLRSPSICYLILGTCTLQLFVSSIGNWMPSFFNRYYGLAPDKAGMRTGLFMIAVSFGVIFFGFVGDRIARNKPARYLGMMSALSLLTALSFISAYSLSAGSMQMILLFCGGFFMLGILGSAYTTIQSLVHPGMWGIAVGVYLLANNLVGMTVGPILGGVLADRFDLITSMLIVSFVPLISVVAYFLAIGRYDQSGVMLGQK